MRIDFELHANQNAIVITIYTTVNVNLLFILNTVPLYNMFCINATSGSQYQRN